MTRRKHPDVFLLDQPAAGQTWASTLDPIHSYLIEGIGESGIVYMVLLNKGERTACTYEWPLSRWAVFVTRGELHLETE